MQLLLEVKTTLFFHNIVCLEEIDFPNFRTMKRFQTKKEEGKYTTNGFVTLAGMLPFGSHHIGRKTSREGFSW